MKKLLVPFGLFLTLFCFCAASPAVYTLTIAGHTARVELALTHEERARGLMFRDSLEEDSGMLFVFDSPGVYSFWMKNTYIPLAIAFIDRHGVIANIEEMLPHDESPTVSRREVVYALEMNAGWFAKKEIAPGMRVLFDRGLEERLERADKTPKGRR